MCHRCSVQRNLKRGANRMPSLQETPCLRKERSVSSMMWNVALSLCTLLVLPAVYYGWRPLVTSFGTVALCCIAEVAVCLVPVSYTHLDVYKRQPYMCYWGQSDCRYSPPLVAEWGFCSVQRVVIFLDILRPLGLWEFYRHGAVVKSIGLH